MSLIKDGPMRGRAHFVAVAMNVAAFVFVAARASAELLTQLQVDNSTIQATLKNSNVRLFGDLDGLAAARCPGDIAPMDTPTILLLDAYDSRLLVRYFEPNANAYGYHAFSSNFLHPHGVTFRSDGRIYVADTANNRIVRLSYTPGTGAVSFVSAFGSYGTGETWFKKPRKVCLDRAGNLYVVDSLNSRIKKFDPAGNPIRSFVSAGTANGGTPSNGLGSFGLDTGQFGIAMAATVSLVDGSIYVADSATNRIQKFDPSGRFIKQITGLPAKGSLRITDLASDLLGRIYAADSVSNVLYILDADLNYLDESHGPVGAPFRSLHGVAIDNSFDAGLAWFSRAQVITSETTRFCVLGFPDVLAAEGGDHYATLNWNHADLPLTGIAGYCLYRSGSALGPYSRIATLAGRGATVYVDMDAETGASYYYKVSILTTAGFEASPIGPVEVTTYPGPSVPALASAYGIPGAIRVTWSPSFPTTYPVAGYDILRAANADESHRAAGPFVPIGRVESPVTAVFLDNTVDSGSLYEYEVRGRDVTGRVGPPTPPTFPARPSADLDWPIFQKDTSHRGSFLAQTVALPASRIWGATAGLDVAVVVRDARVFEATSESLTVLDVYSGIPFWSYGTVPTKPTNLVSAPAVSWNSVFYYSNGVLHAFDVAAGQAKKSAVERWQFSPVPANNQQLSTLTSAPYFSREGVTLANDTVYFGFGGHAFAVDANSGQLKWSIELPGTSVTEFIGPPAVTGETAYFLSSTGRLAAIGTGDYDVTSHKGRLRYAKDLALTSPGSAALTYCNGILYVPSRSFLLALDAVTGKLLWSASDAPAEYQAEVAVSGDDLYAVTRQDGVLRCFSASTGLRRWSFALAGMQNISAANAVSAPAVDGTHIFYAANVRFKGSPSYQGRLVAVSAPSPLGSPVPTLAFLSQEDMGQVDGSPVIAERTAIVGGVAYGRLAAIKLDLAVAQPVVRNQPFLLTIRAVNAAGNVDTEYTGTVQLTCTDPTEVFGGTVPFSALDKGVKAVNRVLRNVGSVTILANDVSRPLLAGSVTLQVMPSTGVAKRLVVTAPSSSQAGMRFSVSVTAVDTAGNVVDTFKGTVELTSTDPLGLLPPPYSFIKTDKGSHLFSATLFTAGYQVVKARDTSTPGGAYGQAAVRVFAGQEYITLPRVRAYYDMDFYGSQNGWIVGSSVTDSDSPLFVHNTGATWVPVAVSSLPTCTIFVDAIGISVNSAQSAWAQVEGINCQDNYANGFLYRQVGGAWQNPVPSPSQQVPVARGIVLTSASDGWLSSLSCFNCSESHNLISRYDGTQWVPYASLPAGVVLNDFRFVKGQPAEGWAKASGVATGLYHYENNAWNEDTTFPYLFGLLSLWMNSPRDLWGGGFGQVLVHYDGTTWTQVDNPAPYGATFNAIHFFDSNHGVAVGGNTGSVYPGQPVIEFYLNGTWYDIPVALPPNFITLGLGGVRMVGQYEAWAYGAGFNIQTGNLEEPQIVHIHLPDLAPQSLAPQMAPALNLNASPLMAPGSLRITSFSVSMSGTAPVPMEIGVNEPCGATLAVYSSAMRPIYTAAFTILGTSYEHIWDGEDEGTGLPAAAGWYMAVLDVASPNGRAERISIFPVLGPGEPSMPIASMSTRERYLFGAKRQEHKTRGKVSAAPGLQRGAAPAQRRGTSALTSPKPRPGVATQISGMR